MNQEQVKEQLLKLNSEVGEFKLIFSGKSSKKVDGLYHPETYEIIIHNKNFEEDNALMYTAIHEFAHHIHYTEFPEKVSNRSHTVLFWDIFHKLLDKAEKMGIYDNIFETDEKFIKLCKNIKDNYLSKNGELMKEFGKLLIQALDLCQQKHAIFEDFVDRALGLNRTAAKSIMKIYAMDVDPNLGYDNMKIVANIKEPSQRQLAEKSFKEGKSPDTVKQFVRENKPEPPVTINRLESEKRRIEKSIEGLKEKLESVEERIQTLQTSES